jgi:hypothetical protein
MSTVPAPPTRELSLGLAGLATHHERVRHRQRPHATALRRCGLDGGGQHRLVGAAQAALVGVVAVVARCCRQRVGRGLWVEERQHHQIERAIGELERNDLTHLRVAASDVHAAGIHQFVVRRNAIGAVVVAGDDGHDVARSLQPHERLAEQHHGFRGRNGPVVHVAGHHHEIDLLGGAHPHHPVDEVGLVGQQRHGPEVATEVPVAGVKNAHTGLRRPTRGWCGECHLTRTQSHHTGVTRKPMPGADRYAGLTRCGSVYDSAATNRSPHSDTTAGAAYTTGRRRRRRNVTSLVTTSFSSPRVSGSDRSKLELVIIHGLPRRARHRAMSHGATNDTVRLSAIRHRM